MIPRFVCSVREIVTLAYGGTRPRRNQAMTFPVNPETYQVSRGRDVEEVSIVGFKDIPRIGNRKIERLTFRALLPNEWSSICNYQPIRPPGEYHARLVRWATSAGGDAALPLRVTIPGLYTGTMILVDMNTETQPAEERGDIWVDLTFMAWTELHARTWNYALPARAPVRGIPAGGLRYTIKAGDNLWNLARLCYGAGSQWRIIWDANKPMRSGNPNLIYPGERILIPSLARKK